MSLGHFNESHAHAWTGVAISNLVPLGTAFETLFGLQQEQDKGKELKRKVLAATGSSILADYIEVFYRTR